MVNEYFSPDNEEYMTLLYAEWLAGVTPIVLWQNVLWEEMPSVYFTGSTDVFRNAIHMSSLFWK